MNGSDPELNARTAPLNGEPVISKAAYRAGWVKKKLGDMGLRLHGLPGPETTSKTERTTDGQVQETTDAR